MGRISRIKRCQRLPGNLQGRDLVVGDLHGHRGSLERELESLRFDPALDRVFSVGDLINRGPDSLGTLSLIEEPWFHAVLGNHDLMLLNYLGYYGSRVHHRASFLSGAGEWVKEALSRHRKQVHRLADRLAHLPLAIHVDCRIPFNVLHGDLALFGSSQANLFDQEKVCIHDADRSTTSRCNFHEALDSTLSGLSFEERLVRVSDTPFRDLHLTYVGHSPVREVVVHNSYIYIDQGVCLRPPGRSERRPPTVVDHAQFSRWLHGVATAWRPPRASSPSRGSAGRFDAPGRAVVEAS